MPSRPPSDHDAAAEPDASAAPSPDSLPEQLLLLTLMASRLLVTELRRSAPEAWLTAPQFRTLHYIYDHPRASLSQVAQHLGVRLPTASVIVVKLADEGLVQRDRDPASRRRLQLVLTDSGRIALEQLRNGVVRELEGRLSKLTEEDRALLEQARPALKAVFTT